MCITIRQDMKILRFLAGFGIAFIASGEAWGQSFNIDVDVEVGGAEAGAGVPSTAFGGAANQPGFWNLLGAARHTQPYPLFDLAGSATTATVRWNVSGGGAGSGMGNNTGDYRLLLNDCTVISVPTTYHFENLSPGRYEITTYAVDRSGRVFPTEVTVPGALVPVRVSGSGEMPGDRFVEGVTHSVHTLNLPGTSFDLTARALSHHGSLNGFQLRYTPVPEPLSISALVLGFGILVLRRQR